MRRHIAALALLLLGACQAWANEISDENARPGAPRSEWDLSGPGSSSIEGFATEISVNRGSAVSFKIKTNSNNWRIDIYRLGYYQGNGARRFDRIVRSTASPQPAPVVDSTTGLVDAGNWSTTLSWTVPSDAASGVFIAHLVDQNSPSNENHIPFVVRNDASTSDIVFQTSDTTWQAYNGWGGANLYGGNGPGAISNVGRAYKVSYNRPFCTRNGESCGTYAAGHDFVFGAESAAIYFLEQHGYDTSYIAGADVARAPARLLQHKLFLSVGHDEYWDTQARANIETARAAGLHLAFLSGNEVYWKTRWEPSIAGSSTAYRTLVCYKETRSVGPLDPLDASPTWTWTGTWRDPRNSPPADGGRPENRLTGTIFGVDAYRSDAIEVPYEMSRLRFWRNAPLSNASPGVTTTLTQNILGYEWDVAPNDWFAPGSAINLSSTTLNVSSLLIDYGTRTGPADATHNITLYKDPASGAIVFGAGTVFWAWGLSDEHDGPTTPTDRNIQQATVNLLADMGAQPATLQPPLAAASPSLDATAPVTVISNPANGATFEEGVPVTIAGTASDAGGRVAGVEVSIDDGVTWRKANGATSWTFGWNATPGAHVIRARATDDSLNTETPSSGLTVTVTSGGATLFGVVDIPERQTVDDVKSVELGTIFSPAVSGAIKGVRFFKNLINAGPHQVRLWSASGALLAQATSVNETPSGWQTVLFPAPVFVNAGATYTASYHTEAYYSATTAYFTSPVTVGSLTAPSAAGVYRYSDTPVFPDSVFNDENYWVDVLFATSPPTAPPVITSPTVASGAVGAPFSYQITATNGATQFGASPLPPGLTINTGTGLISGTPTASGPTSITLTATNALGTGTSTLNLTIDAAIETFSLFSLSDVPATLTDPDSNSVELGVKFTSAVPGQITGMRFYKGPQNTGAHPARLWSAAGDLLGSANFSGETASGWQTVQFAAPITIAAGATYVASYHTNGFYSASGNYFAAARTNGPLTAPSSAAAGGNGVYVYGSASAFPTSSFNATNYWVDVLFKPNAPQPPVIQPPLAASGVEGSPFTYLITATNSPTSFDASPLPAGLSINPTTGAITGTPTQTGVFNVTLTATNAAGAGTATLALTISPAASKPVITSALSANGIVGTPFTYTIQATNNPTSFGASPLPAGLSVNPSTGVISGTPTAGGSFTVTLTATNAAGAGTASLALTILGPPVISGALSANGAVGAPFTYAIQANNNPTSYGAAPLPPGLSIDTTTGVISGTPTAGGDFTVTLTATNAAGAGTASLALTILAPPVITGALSANGVVGAPFTYAIQATNSPTSYSAAPLPAGLSINATTGVISGTPTASGAFFITLTATNAAGAGTATLALTIAPNVTPPVIQAPLTASGATGAPFSYQINATGSPTSYGAAPLPAGLTVNPLTGQITGTPTTAGAFSVTLSATNAAGTGNATLALTISAPPVITSASTANGAVGVAFSYQITATNSPTSYNASPLPGGLTVNTATGRISGTPTTSGTTNITLSATNTAGTGTATLGLSILPRFTLSVTRNNSRGRVTSSPTGINCGSDCSEPYVSGTSVTLTATPNAGRLFLGWSGACTGLSRTCVVLMDSAKTARATFL